MNCDITSGGEKTPAMIKMISIAYLRPVEYVFGATTPTKLKKTISKGNSNTIPKVSEVYTRKSKYAETDIIGLNMAPEYPIRNPIPTGIATKTANAQPA
ncbi:MAG: hypothetical protein BWY32_03754 [bacterium ADurb.Bin243]|nr:MAG: hypothetical protein BWY32_03754 [bacterium ADurb.Bin243]